VGQLQTRGGKTGIFKEISAAINAKHLLHNMNLPFWKELLE